MERSDLQIIDDDSAALASSARPPSTHPAADDEQLDATKLRLADELYTWLRALDSFFQWHHHPRADDQVPDPLNRDWIPETRITRDALLRIRHLALSLRRTAPTADSVGGLRIDDRVLAEVDELVGDACAVCDALVSAARTDFQAWTGFGRMLTRDLRRTGATAELDRVLREREARTIHPSLRRLATSAAPAALAADLLHVFASLTGMLAELRYITPLLKSDSPLKSSLPILTLIHDEAKRLIVFIEKRALRIEGVDAAVFDTLDGTAYALGMELRKIFAHELGDISAARHAPLIYSKIETAHGLLRDAFQQAVITLAQSLDPNSDASELFDVIRTKLDQSLALRNDAWALLKLIRTYERNPAAADLSLGDLLERSQKFRDGSMQYLMYKDWEAYELFLEELSRARGVPEALPVLHRFATYLDTLLGQINMRAVLKDHPFDPNAMTAPRT